MAAPPAGWYDDPERAGQQRWWDGSAWGEQRRPAPPPAESPPPPPPPAARAATGPQGASWSAGGGSSPAATRPQEGIKGTASHWILPMGRSPWAVAAGYLGLLSVIPFVGVAAIVCGVLGLRRIAADPVLGGRGRAWFGIVLGAAGTVFTIFLFTL